MKTTSRVLPSCLVLLTLPLAIALPARQAGAEDEIPEITVAERRVANTDPAAGYASPATLLRFDPATELQSRGMPEGQADVTVRGGLFENTGFRIGAVTIMDPQTGHYVAGLPVDPASLSIPTVLTGIDNALAGFNSNVATISYALPALQDGGAASVGAGSDNLRFGSVRAVQTSALASGASLRAAIAAAFSAGDGSVANGDHEFRRVNVQLQRAAGRSQSDLVLALQDKFYGWPGAYTGFATLPETDDTQTALLLASHRVEQDRGHWQIGAFYRRLDDDYDFNRTTLESGAPGSFDHATRVYGVGADGVLQRGGLEWHYAAQLSSDALLRSTDLTNSDFTRRHYAKLSVVPAVRIELASDRSLTLRVGGTIDVSSRDDDVFSPVLGLTLDKQLATGLRRVTLEYAGTSQVPGYTVLASGASGLFGGNADLGREKSRQLMLGLNEERLRWRASIAVFYREDDALVDWTFSSASPFARQANAVDLEVLGVEARYRRSWDALQLVVAYTYLDKDADYGAAAVDASFYALNFARHRATLALRYELGEQLEVRVDHEYRLQESNALRSSSDRGQATSAALVWQSLRAAGFSVAVTADNLADDDFQQFPGTPAVGRQVSVSGRYAW